MIAFVRGQVAAVTLTSAVVEVGGVGLELMCTPGTLATLRLGHQAQLPTSMVVREDSLTLFGFLDDDEKQIFELVQTASGVGPKVAQAMLAVLSPDDVRRAIAADDVKTLTRVPGHRPEGRPADHPRAQGPDRRADRRPLRPPSRCRTRPGATRCTRAWSGLGWSTRDAEKAVDAVAPEAGDTPDIASLLRAALRSLSKA